VALHQGAAIRLGDDADRGVALLHPLSICWAIATNIMVAGGEEWHASARLVGRFIRWVAEKNAQRNSRLVGKFLKNGPPTVTGVEIVIAAIKGSRLDPLSLRVW